jgi:hypothetical protein
MAEGEVKNKKKGFWAEVAEGVLNGKPEFNNFAPDVKATIRADWIQARAAALVDHGFRPFEKDVEKFWSDIEAIYTEGQKRGLLP